MITHVCLVKTASGKTARICNTMEPVGEVGSGEKRVDMNKEIHFDLLKKFYVFLFRIRHTDATDSLS